MASTSNSTSSAGVPTPLRSTTTVVATAPASTNTSTLKNAHPLVIEHSQDQNLDEHAHFSKNCASRRESLKEENYHSETSGDSVTAEKAEKEEQVRRRNRRKREISTRHRIAPTLVTKILRTHSDFEDEDDEVNMDGSAYEEDDEDDDWSGNVRERKSINVFDKMISSSPLALSKCEEAGRKETNVPLPVEKVTQSVSTSKEAESSPASHISRRQFVDEQLSHEEFDTAVTSSEILSSHFNLRWKNHPNHILLAFESLLYNETFVDVTLVCDPDDDEDDDNDDNDDHANETHTTEFDNYKAEKTVKIRAHKIVLSACSEYFQRIFAENPCKHPVIVLKDFHGWEVQALIDFMYRGEVDVSSDRLATVIKAAESLQIRGLLDYVNKFESFKKSENEKSNNNHGQSCGMPTGATMKSPQRPPQSQLITEAGEKHGVVKRQQVTPAALELDDDVMGDDEEEDEVLLESRGRPASPKLLNLSMGASHLRSSKTSSLSSSSSTSARISPHNECNASFQREEPQTARLQTQSQSMTMLPATGRHQTQQQPLHTDLPGDNHYSSNLSVNNVTNHNNSFIPRRKQARPRRRSGDFVAQDLRKTSAGAAAASLLCHVTPDEQAPVQLPLLQIPPSPHNSEDHPGDFLSKEKLLPVPLPSQLTLQRRHSHIRHRRSSRKPYCLRNTGNREMEDEDEELDRELEDADAVLDYRTNSNSLQVNPLRRAWAMEVSTNKTPSPPQKRRSLINPLKRDTADSNEESSPNDRYGSPLPSPDGKPFPGDFSLFGLGPDPPHLHGPNGPNRNCINLPGLAAFKTSPPSPSAFFLGLNANGPLSLPFGGQHSDESNNGLGESPSTPPNVFSPAGFPLSLPLPLGGGGNGNHLGHPVNQHGPNNLAGGGTGAGGPGHRGSPVGWPGVPLGPAPIFGRHRAQHSAPRGGPPRAWSNADLTEALHNVWNKKMTTSQASRIFGIPYNSLLMYVRGKYGKSLKLDLLKKGLDMALENAANKGGTNSSNSSSTPSVTTPAITTNNNISSSTKESSSNHHQHHNNNNPSATNNNNTTRTSPPSSNNHRGQNHNNNYKSKGLGLPPPHHHHHHHHPHHHHHSAASPGASPPLGLANLGLGLVDPPDIPAGFNPFAAASLFGEYPGHFPFASALSHILPPGGLAASDRVGLNDDDK